MERHELLQDLAAKIITVKLPHPVRVAIDGVDAAGKTTLADELAPAIQNLGRPVVRARRSMDFTTQRQPAAVRRHLMAIFTILSTIPF